MAERKTATLVATTNGQAYSILLRKEKKWITYKPQKKKEYVAFEKYTPHHLKNLKRACKLFLQERWPAFASYQQEQATQRR